MTLQRDDDGYGIFESDPRLTAGNLQIIACVGSGKTEFVSARVAYMVSRGIARPGNIVAFTFTEKAAKELKFSIRSKIRGQIIDFKTGNERRLEEELMLQVRLYTVAARESLSLDGEKAYVHFLDERKNERVEIRTDEPEFDNAMQTIRGAVKGVTERNFGRRPKDKKICRDCDWKRLCPGSM